MKSGLLQILCILVGALLQAKCDWRRPTPPARHPNVPPSAVWAGWTDGGRWIDCRVRPDGNLCTAYSDQTGDVEFSGRYVLEGANRPATVDELQYVSAPDRTFIHLKGGRRLKLTVPPRPPNVPKTALWSGGGEESEDVWIACDVAREVNICATYNNNGEPGLAGRFVRADTGKAATENQLQRGYIGVYHDTILLSGGAYLKSTDGAR